MFFNAQHTASPPIRAKQSDERRAICVDLCVNYMFLFVRAQRLCVFSPSATATVHGGGASILLMCVHTVAQHPLHGDGDGGTQFAVHCRSH